MSSQNNAVDLSGEFERQFFGDVMLFTIERLADMGYPGRTFPREFVEKTLNATEKRIHMQYAQKHREIVNKIMVLNSIISHKEIWWNMVFGLDTAKENLKIFLRNMERNFGVGSICYDLIGSLENKKKRMQGMLDAIMTYSDGREVWEDALSKTRLGARGKR